MALIPEACENVLVDDCTFEAGDDCTAIKAGKNRDTQHGSRVIS